MFMRILITGGAGFIGSSLAEVLLARGHSVVILDNLCTGSRSNLEGIFKKIMFVQGDILDDDTVRHALGGVDAVAHLAGLIDEEESMKKGELYHHVNAAGTLKMLQHSASMNVKKFVFTSSCAVYGEPMRVPIKETDPVAPISHYADNKLEAEEQCENFNNTLKLKTLVFRVFHVYGPKMKVNHYNEEIAGLIDNAKWTNSLKIFGDGEQTRDFIFIKDVTMFIAAALENNLTGLYNLGSGQPVTIKKAAETISALLGMKTPYMDFKSPRDGDLRQNAADITKLVNEFGMKPEYDLEKGLAEFKLRKGLIYST
jgi:UDP-glucose 4-epimerase